MKRASNIKLWLLLYFLGLSITGTISCRKESSPKESRIDLLTGRKWQLMNLYFQEKGDNAASDFTSIHYKTCEMDDSYHFTKGNVFFRRDSTETCSVNPSFGLFGAAEWTTDSVFSKITFNSFPAYRYNMEIKTLNENTLELTHLMRDYFLKEITFTYRFRAIR